MGKKRDSDSSFESRRGDPDSGDAFVSDVGRGHGPLDADAEDFAEEFVASATSGEDMFEDARDEIVWEEIGGPFVDSAPIPMLDIARASRWAGRRGRRS